MEEKKPKTIDDRIYEAADAIVLDFYKTYSSPLINYKDRLSRYNKLYKCICDPREAGRANVFVPEIHIAVETMVADIIEILMSEEPFFTSEEMPEDINNHMKKMEAVMWKLMCDAGFKRKLIKYIRRLAIEGSVPAYIYWEKEVKEVTDKVLMETSLLQSIASKISPYKPKQKYETKKISRVVRDYMDFDAPSYESAFFDPFTDIRLARGVLFSWVYDVTRLDGLVNQGRANSGRVDLVKKESQTKILSVESQISDERKAASGYDSKNVAKPKDVEFLCYWGKIPKYLVYPELIDNEEGKKEIEGEILFCGKTIGISETNYWDGEKPVVIGKWIEMDNEEFSISVASINEKTQLEVNETRNQMLDHKNFALYNMWLKSRGAMINNSDLVIKPNQIIECEGDVRTALMPLRPDSAAFQEGNLLEGVQKDDIRRASGATSAMQGAPSKTGRQTAKEIMMMQSRAGMRSMLIATTIAETFLKPLLNKYWYLVKENVNNPVKIIGTEGVELIETEQIYGDYTWTPKVLTDPINKVSVKSTLMGLIDSLGRIPGMAGPGIYGLGRKLYTYSGFKDVDAVFPPLPGEAFRTASPANEEKILASGTMVRAYEFQDHLKHNESHIQFRAEMVKKYGNDKNNSVLKVTDLHIQEHFEYGQVKVNMQLESEKAAAQSSQVALGQGPKPSVVPPVI